MHRIMKTFSSTGNQILFPRKPADGSQHLTIFRLLLEAAFIYAFISENEIKKSLKITSINNTVFRTWQQKITN